MQALAAAKASRREEEERALAGLKQYTTYTATLDKACGVFISIVLNVEKG